MKQRILSTFVVAAAALVAAAAPASATHQDPNVGDQYGNPAPTPIPTGTVIPVADNAGRADRLGAGDVVRIPNVQTARRGLILVLRDRNGTRITIIAGRNAIVRLVNGRLVIRMISRPLFQRGTRPFNPTGMTVTRSAGIFS